ncbi:MAG: hypothetical protein QOH63_2165 [Acidobacteriota bacterium]|nr:hypothetical protein [Acidobacteriota bacterium]
MDAQRKSIGALVTCLRRETETGKRSIMSKAVTDVQARLLRRGAPKPDENLLGYIVRLTELNGYETPSWITMLGHVGQRGSRWKQVGETGLSNCALTFYGAAYYDGLAQLTGSTTEIIQRAAYPAAPPARRGTARYWTFGEPVSRTLISFKPKICPGCLAEENYCRKVWDLTVVVACPIHRSLLITHCPKCQQNIRWHRSEVSRCHQCGADWRSYRTQGWIPDQELNYLQQIYRRCGLPTDMPSTSVGGNPLYELSLEDYISVLFFFASQFAALNESTGRYLIKQGAEKLHTLLVRAFDVFEDFPHKYQEFLRWRRTVSTKLHEYKINFKPGLYKDFGYFWGALYREFAEPRFAFLRDAFERYLCEEWDSGHLSLYSRLNESTRFSEDKKYLTRNHAMQLLKTNLGWLDRFADEGRIKVKVTGTAHKRVMLYDADDVRRIRAEFDQSLGNRSTAKRLGIGVKQLKELVELGCITALRGREVDGCKIRRFSIAAVDEFLKKLNAAIEHIPDRKAKRIDLHSAVRCVGRTSIKMVAFIHSVLNGELRPCGWEKRKGVYGLLFLESDVLAYIEHEYWKNNAQQLTINRAAKKLNMRFGDLKFLVEKGFIEVEANTTNRMVRMGARVISASELERFVATYVPAVHLAYELKRTSRRVLKVLRTKNIFPVTGKAIDGGRLYLIRRSDLAAVDLKQLLAQA